MVKDVPVPFEKIRTVATVKNQIVKGKKQTQTITVQESDYHSKKSGYMSCYIYQRWPRAATC